MANTREITPEDKVYVRKDLYLAGNTEEGHPFEAEGFYVVVERLDGHRIAHNFFFEGAKWEEQYDPEYGDISTWADIREEAQAKAEEVVRNILAYGKLNLDHWVEIDPAYGSAYYCICNNCNC